jgi:hypothetical protein
MIACTVDETCGQSPTAEELKTWCDLKPVIESVAKRVYWQYRKFVELDDVVQEAWLAYFSNERALSQLLNSVAGLTYVRRRLQSACNTYAVKEMCQRTGVQWEDQYQYTNGEVRSLVTLALAGGPDGTEHESVITGFVEVKAALLKLNKDDLDSLWLAYGPDPRDSQLSSTDRGRASRAIRRMQRALNGEEDQREPPESAPTA